MNKAQQIITLTEKMGIDESFVTNLTQGLSSGMKKLTGMATAGAQKVKHAQLGTKASNLLKRTGQAAGQAYQTGKERVKKMDLKQRRATGLLNKMKTLGQKTQMKPRLGGKTPMSGLVGKAQAKLQNFKSRIPGSYPGREKVIRQGVSNVAKNMGNKAKQFYQQGKSNLENPVQGPSRAGFLLNKAKGAVQKKGSELGGKAKAFGAQQAAQTKQDLKGHAQRVVNYMSRDKNRNIAPGKIVKARKAIANKAGDVAHNIKMAQTYTRRQHRKHQQQLMQNQGQEA